MMMLPFPSPFDTAVEVVLNPLVSTDTAEVECLFDLVAARMLCSRDDRKRLNVLS